MATNKKQGKTVLISKPPVIQCWEKKREKEIAWSFAVAGRLTASSFLSAKLGIKTQPGNAMQS